MGGLLPAGCRRSVTECHHASEAFAGLATGVEAAADSVPRISSLLRLADGLFESPVLTVPEAQRILGMSYPGARRNVDRLVEAGILKQVSETAYGKAFFAQAILEAISERSKN